MNNFAEVASVESDEKWGPKVTVITIVLNGVDVIESTLKSVTTQDYSNLEYVVIDGQSTDGTLKLIQKYSTRIDVLVSEKDHGVYHAMNKGADLANGEWIVFMNGGDRFVEKDVISKVFATADWHSADVVYGDGIFCELNGERRIINADRIATFREGNGFFHQSVFMKAALQKEYGFDVTERIAADYDLFLRLYKAGRIFKHVDVVVSEFVAGGLSSAQPQAEGLKMRHRIYKKHLPRSNLGLYLSLAFLNAKNAIKRLLPVRAVQGIRRMRTRG